MPGSRVSRRRWLHPKHRCNVLIFPDESVRMVRISIACSNVNPELFWTRFATCSSLTVNPPPSFQQRDGQRDRAAAESPS